jgi:hypothetical protein
MNFKNIKKILKKNYKKIIIVCLIMLIFSNKMYENFSTTQALDAVKSTETKVNNMATLVGGDYIDLKSKIKLSGKWSAYPDKAKDQAEIANDRGTYKKLMIVGNKSDGGVRKVGVWDHLQVHGSQNIDSNLAVGGNLTVNGINNKKKSWYWKEGSAQLANGKGLHYLDRHAVHCREGEFMSGIKWLRSGNNLKTTILCSKLN